MNGLVHPHDIILETRTTRTRHDLQALQMPPQPLANLRGLQRQLPGRDQDHDLDVPQRRVHHLQTRDQKRAGLPRAVLRPRENVLPGECHRNCLLLDRTRLLEPHLKDPHQKLALQKVVLERVALGRGHVERLHPGVFRRQRQRGLPVLLRRRSGRGRVSVVGGAHGEIGGRGSGVRGRCTETLDRLGVELGGSSGGRDSGSVVGLKGGRLGGAGRVSTRGRSRLGRGVGSGEE
mmetsp:Transcript_26782/g.67172  ORF Transcript_26782/g.67172 Transcript_26782/m.67172 type:complete len:234 (+) Transcript_26782:1781-2482(+)